MAISHTCPGGNASARGLLLAVAQRAADIVRDELKYLGLVRRSESTEAQQRLIEIIRRLEEEGQIEATLTTQLQEL